jgi:hypothetical protein
LHLRYFSYDTLSNDFRIFLDKGDFLKGLSPKGTDPEARLKTEAQELLKYFFIGVTLPDSCFWVNLRPDSEAQIIDPVLARTDFGKVLLEADLELKKDTARFTSPQTPEGRRYWGALYQKAGEIFGYDQVTIPTLTRPWIVPGEVIIRETKESGFVYKATLKVMLEQDHLKNSVVYDFKDPRLKALNDYSSELIRKNILPKLTREVNTAKKYAPLRQAYYSLILARWFKLRFKNQPGKYPQLIDRGDLTDLTSTQSWSPTTYFKAYQKSFQDGEYKLQEPVNTPFGQVIRSYFSGGVALGTIGYGGYTAKSPVNLKALGRARLVPVVPTDRTGGLALSLLPAFSPSSLPDNGGLSGKPAPAAPGQTDSGRVYGSERGDYPYRQRDREIASMSKEAYVEREIVGSEVVSAETFAERFASGITVYSPAELAPDEEYTGNQLLKPWSTAGLSTAEQKMWEHLLEIFTAVFSRSNLFNSGATFKSSFRLFEANENSTAFVHTVGEGSVFYINREWLENLVALEERLGVNNLLSSKRLPAELQAAAGTTITDSIIYAVAFHEIGGHHWGLQTQDKDSRDFIVALEDESITQFFRGGETYGVLNAAAYKFYLKYAGIPTQAFDESVDSNMHRYTNTIASLVDYFHKLLPAPPCRGPDGPCRNRRCLWSGAERRTVYGAGGTGGVR